MKFTQKYNLKNKNIRMMTRNIFIIMFVFCSLCACSKDVVNPATTEGIASVKWINLEEDINMDRMNLYEQRDQLKFLSDDNAKISLYVNTEMNEDAQWDFDTGQDWMLLMETSFGKFQLFPRQLVQHGKIKFEIFNDKNDITHVIVIEQQSASYQIYDCVFDNNKTAFKVVEIYNIEDIVFLAMFS